MAKLRELKPLVQVELKRLLYERFKEWIIKERLEEGEEPNRLGSWDISTDFHMLSGYSCYDVHRCLVDNEVIPVGVNHDHEHSCCYYYFPTLELAYSFCMNLATFFVKRTEVALQNLLPIEKWTLDILEQAVVNVQWREDHPDMIDLTKQS